MLCAIWYHFYNLKNVKNTFEGMSLLVKLQAYFTKSNTLLWLFFTFLNLHKWYQIVQHITLKINHRCKSYSQYNAQIKKVAVQATH